MKTISCFFILFAQLASASPYFRPIDIHHPSISAGVYSDPTGAMSPDSGAAVPLITHSTKDGSIFKSLQADWSPLAVGAGRSSSGAFMAVGPVANLAPAVKGSMLATLDLVAPGRFANIRQLLAPVPDSTGVDASVAFGPAWLIKPVSDGAWVDPKSWKGYFRLFFGGSLKF
jgi:hypothetical protein